MHAPADAPKARLAVAMTLDHFRRSDVDVTVRLSNELPRGKGMASSTADVSASIAATSAALGQSGDMLPSEIARIALLVEPSDGLMLPGISMFDHRNGTVTEILGEAPSMRVVVLDFGGNVDTLEFNSVSREHTLRRLQPQFEEALALVKLGVEVGCAEYIGAGATLSTIANQEVLDKPQLDYVLSVAPSLGSVGVNVAHSGTVVGMLFRDDAELVECASSCARKVMVGLENVYERRIVNGGAYLIEGTGSL